MDTEGWLMRVAYPCLAGVAGAVTALAFMRWKEMTRTEIGLTLFVGASFAIFVTPWLAQFLPGGPTSRTVAGLTYLAASGSNTLLPMLIRWTARSFGMSQEGAGR